MSNMPKPSRHLFWPILLTSLISIHIVCVAVMVTIATRDSSFAVEPDWYEKGLHYDQTAEQQRENRRLGWSVQLKIGRPMSDTSERTVTCTVRDRSGKPVRDATVDMVAFAHLRASKRISSVLLSREGGEYAASLACDDPGLWEFRLVITHGKETFTQKVQREI